jgi:UDP-N-acetylmuramyl pentapeptide phosphotransferase/UDP-N-acetylglucosamine-1-phosphate transferase
MTVATVIAVGALALLLTAALERSTRESFAAPAMQRENYSGRSLATGVGALIPVGTIVVAGTAALARAAEVDSIGRLKDSLFFTAALVVGFGFLGLLDDVLGAGQSGGFRGHLREMRRGHLTTGMIKWLGGGALAVALLGLGNRGDLSRLIADGAVIALAANLANLLDRRPGRATKFAVVALVPLLVSATHLDSMAGPVTVVGAAIGLAPGELRERYMLGDSGANALGAAVGWALVIATTPVGRDVALVVLLALNVASEVVSFSTVIERVPGLRHFDQLGRRM